MIAGDVAPSTDPDVPGGRVGQLPREALAIWQIHNAVGIVATAALALAFFHGPIAPGDPGPWEAVVLAAAAGVGLVEALVLIPRRYATYRFALLDDSVVVVRGRMISRRRVFPYSRILYVETHQGPVLRHFGLVTVRIGTIAEPHGFGPLPPEVADELERRLQALKGPADPPHA